MERESRTCLPCWDGLFLAGLHIVPVIVNSLEKREIERVQKRITQSIVTDFCFISRLIFLPIPNQPNKRTHSNKIQSCFSPAWQETDSESFLPWLVGDNTHGIVETKPGSLYCSAELFFLSRMLCCCKMRMETLHLRKDGSVVRVFPAKTEYVNSPLGLTY